MHRKSFWIVMILAALFGLTGSAWAQNFQGTLDLHMATSTLTNDGTAYMKEMELKMVPKDNVQLEGIEGYPIVDFKAQKLYLISPQDKYYLTLPLGQLQAPIDKMNLRVQRSGKTDTILGHPVEEWVATDPQSKTQGSIWATRDMHAAVNFLISLQKFSPGDGLLLGAMAKSIIGQGYFPLAATATSASGTVTLSMRIQAIHPQPLADSEFAIPDGYGKMSDMLRNKR